MLERNLIVLDENLDPALKRQLQNRGYEAESLRDLHLLSVKDDKLLARLGERYRNERWTLATADRRMTRQFAQEVANSGCALAILEDAGEDGEAKNDRVHRWAHLMSSQSPGTVRRYFEDTTSDGPPPRRSHE